ncbi:MAG TPA: hypothetical protein PKX87_06990 [Alphaproteobacteria bacterium]|nr:hypothetical protein [Alphaproteobacteria bacterium]
MRREQDFFEDEEAGDRPVRNLWQALDSADRPATRRPLLTVMTLSATVAVLVAVLWYSYPREVEIRNRLSAPVLHADAQPARIAPEEPGGMEIPHRDSAVFEAINTAEAAETPSVENLLSAEEEPMPKARLFAGLNTDSLENAGGAPDQVPPASADGQREKADASPVPTEISETLPAAQSQPTPSATASPVKTPSAAMAPGTVQKVIGLAPATEIPQPALAPKVAPSLHPSSDMAKAPSKDSVKTSAAKPDQVARKIARTEPAAGAALGSATRGSHYVQLSSVRERSRANAEWAALQRRFPGPLSGIGMRVQEADLGA